MNTSALMLAPDIAGLIHLIREQRAILDANLASLYGVSTKALNQAVKRNRERFPQEFMFQLSWDEVSRLNSLRSQNVTLKRGTHLKYRPYAFRTDRKQSLVPQTRGFSGPIRAERGDPLAEWLTNRRI